MAVWKSSTEGCFIHTWSPWAGGRYSNTGKKGPVPLEGRDGGRPGLYNNTIPQEQNIRGGEEDGEEEEEGETKRRTARVREDFMCYVRLCVDTYTENLSYHGTFEWCWFVCFF